MKERRSVPMKIILLLLLGLIAAVFGSGTVPAR